MGVVPARKPDHLERIAVLKLLQCTYHRLFRQFHGFPVDSPGVLEKEVKVAHILPVVEGGSETATGSRITDLRIFIASASRRGTFSRWQGAPLVVIYMAYIVLQYEEN